MQRRHDELELLQNYKSVLIEFSLNLLMCDNSHSQPGKAYTLTNSPCFDTSSTHTSENTSIENKLKQTTSKRNTLGQDTSANSKSVKSKRNTLSHTNIEGEKQRPEADRRSSDRLNAGPKISKDGPPSARKRGILNPTQNPESNKRLRTSKHRDEDDAWHDQQTNETVVPTESLSTFKASRFACPYFKHDPKEYSRRSACSGPGWESVHRLKYLLTKP